MTKAEVIAKQEKGEELTDEEKAILAEPEPPEGEPKEGDEVEVDGSKYVVDDKGNYCIQAEDKKMPVLDSKKVPYFNRTGEWHRKAAETENQYLRRIDDLEVAHKKELEEINKPPAGNEPNPEDIDPTTGLTYGAIDSLEKRFGKKIKDEGSASQLQTLELVASISVENQIIALKADKDYATFFANDKYEKEVRDELARTSPQTRLQPNIVKDAISLVAGRHIKDIETNAESRGRKSATERREIVEEVRLGEPIKTESGKSVTMTPEIRKFASEMGLPEKEAAEIYINRQNRRNKAKKTEGEE